MAHGGEGVETRAGRTIRTLRNGRKSRSGKVPCQPVAEALGYAYDPARDGDGRLSACRDLAWTTGPVPGC